MIGKQEVQHIAQLSRLSLSDSEVESFGPQLNSILAYMEKLGKLDTSGVEPTSHVIELTNVTRQDREAPCLSPAEALQNAPDPVDDSRGSSRGEGAGGFYRVPRIID